MNTLTLWSAHLNQETEIWCGFRTRKQDELVSLRGAKLFTNFVVDLELSLYSFRRRAVWYSRCTRRLVLKPLQFSLEPQSLKTHYLLSLSLK